MSRSGYTSDGDEDRWAQIRWRGAVKSAINGKRGQAALREMLAALDAMPTKALVAKSFSTGDGEFCTLGALGAARGVELPHIDPDDDYVDDVSDEAAQALDISRALAAEVMWVNDEHTDDERWVDVEICGPMRPHWPEFGRHIRSKRETIPDAAQRRWLYMRNWIASQIKD
jgi:hypothetical protein